jgi:excisionase family DNA binding protein
MCVLTRSNKRAVAIGITASLWLCIAACSGSIAPPLSVGNNSGGLTSAEVAALLRTSKKAVYAMVERRQLPGVVRLGRRVLFRQSTLVDWLRQKSAPSLER